MAMATAMADLVSLNGVLPIHTTADPSPFIFFLEPCLLLSASYSHHALLPSRYYSRSFFMSPTAQPAPGRADQTDDKTRLEKEEAVEEEKKKKRKKRRKKQQESKKRKMDQASPLNAKELAAFKRHQEVRKLIFDAHTAFLESPGVINCLRNIETEIIRSKTHEAVHQVDQRSEEHIEIKGTDLVDLGTVWQASLCEMTFSKVGGSETCYDSPTCPLFNYMVANYDDEELVGTSFGTSFVIPKKSGFFMSDIADIQQLIPCTKQNGYNLILIDPPWENKSVHRNGLYPTLPNKYLLSLPLKELAHTNGAIVGLWVTNREKLRSFVDKELLPAWGVVNCATWYWLKVKSSGEMVTDLDFPRQKPYECLLLGFIPPEAASNFFVSYVNKALFSKVLPEKCVLISIPGYHSRKPPISVLLSKFMAKQEPVRGLELFARDMNPGWTSWGNEPLLFQQASYFEQKKS